MIKNRYLYQFASILFRPKLSYSSLIIVFSDLKRRHDDPARIDHTRMGHSIDQLQHGGHVSDGRRRPEIESPIDWSGVPNSEYRIETIPHYL